MVNSKIAVYGAAAVIILFALSMFGVVLSSSSGSQTTPTNASSSQPTFSSTANFTGSGSGKVFLAGFAGQFIVECNTSANPDTISQIINNYTVELAAPTAAAAATTTVTQGDQNASNATGNQSPAAGEPQNYSVQPFANAFEAANSLYVAQENQTASGPAEASLGSRGLFFGLTVALQPYCQASIIRYGLVTVNDPMVFQSASNPVSGITGTAGQAALNRTVSPIEFQGYADMYASQSGQVTTTPFSQQSYVPAYVSPDAPVNSTIDVLGQVTYTNDVLSQVIFQQEANGPDSQAATSISQLPINVTVTYWDGSSEGLQAQLPWGSRNDYNSSQLTGLLNSTPYLLVPQEASYSPYDTVLVNATQANSSNLTLLQQQVSNLSFVTSQSMQGTGGLLVLQVASNQTNQSQVVAGLGAAGVPIGAITFPASTLSVGIQLEANTTDLAALAAMEALVPLAQNVTLLHTVTVSPVDPAAASTMAQVLLPAQFAAQVSPAKVDASNRTQITATVISQGMQLISVYGQTQ